MDSIVKKLSEIETAAAAIVEHAEAQKEILEEEMAKKRDQFDKDVEARTLRKIDEIRTKLEQQTSQVLASQTGCNDTAIAALKKEFDEKHELYAKEILARMTEV